MTTTTGPVFWVAIPFPSREQAESAQCEVEEMGYRAAVVEATAAMVKRYVNAPDLRDAEVSS